jgi:acyl carrier protein
MNAAAQAAVADSATIQTDVLDLLGQLARDWEYSGTITADTLLFGDLGFESIDAVVLASFVQERYGQPFPFPELLAEIGKRQIKDLTIRELVEFIRQHLNTAAAGAES